MDNKYLWKFDLCIEQDKNRSDFIGKKPSIDTFFDSLNEYHNNFGLLIVALGDIQGSCICLQHYFEYDNQNKRRFNNENIKRLANKYVYRHVFRFLCC
jgi:hypothetical protein